MSGFHNTCTGIETDPTVTPTNTAAISTKTEATYANQVLLTEDLRMNSFCQF
jgi:hypothetical protein